MPGRSKKYHRGAPTGSGNGPKLKENKDLTSKPLFLKDLAEESRQSIDSKRPVMGGGYTHYRPANTPRTRKSQKILPANPPPRNLFSGEQTENRELPLRFY